MRPRPIASWSLRDFGRFLTYINELDNGCWEWAGGKNNHGYGQFSLNRATILAHRFAYVATRGEVGTLTLDHVCRNRACVRPDHLDPVDHRTNVLRGQSPTAKNARKTCCGKCGGELTTMYLHYRGCRPCRRATQRERARSNPDGVRERRRRFWNRHGPRINALARSSRIGREGE